MLIIIFLRAYAHEHYTTFCGVVLHYLGNRVSCELWLWDGQWISPVAEVDNISFGHLRNLWSLIRTNPGEL